MSTTTIHSLNDDCLELLFTQFTLLEWITVLRVVCTRWNALISRMHHSAFLTSDEWPVIEENEFEWKSNLYDQTEHINQIINPNEMYFFKRIHFLLSWERKSQTVLSTSESFWQEFLRNLPFWYKPDVALETFPRNVWNNENEEEGGLVQQQFQQTIKDRLDPFRNIVKDIEDFVVRHVRTDFLSLLTTQVSMYHEASPNMVKRLGSFHSLLSVAVFGKILGTDDIDVIKVEHNIPDIIWSVTQRIQQHNIFNEMNCQCTVIDSPDNHRFESVKLYHEIASVHDYSKTKANLVGCQICPLLRRMRPEVLSTESMNCQDNLQTFEQMYQLELKLRIPSTKVLQNFQYLKILILEFRISDNIKFDQTMWEDLLSLAQLDTLRIWRATIEMCILERVVQHRNSTSLVRKLCLVEVAIVLDHKETQNVDLNEAQYVNATLLTMFPNVTEVCLHFIDAQQYLAEWCCFHLRKLSNKYCASGICDCTCKNILVQAKRWRQKD